MNMSLPCLSQGQIHNETLLQIYTLKGSPKSQNGPEQEKRMEPSAGF